MHMGGMKWAAQVAAIGLAAVCVAWAAMPGADAQQSQPQTQPRRGGISRTDSAGNVVPVVFSADEVTYDDPLGIIIARGNVEISQAGQTVLADVVAYNQHTDTVTASGHVTIIRASGETVNAEYADLTDQLNDGFLQDIRMMLADRTRVVGNTARRTGDGNRTEIRKGVYSPCDLCKDDPSEPPLWQLQAETIVHNKEQQLIEYNDATLDLFGFPIFYTPYLSTPDPTAKRASGFLPPSIGESSFLGAFARVPYYWAINEDSDLTFAPMYTSAQGPVLEGEYRERFSNGELYFQGSITQGSIVTDTVPEVTTPNQVRGDINSWGKLDLDEDIRAGYLLNRTTDQTYLELYRLGGTQAFLTSRAYLEDFDGRDYGVVNAYDFQSLQANVSDKTQPIVLPSTEYTWAGAPTSWGGKFTTTVSGMDLQRETGSSSQRLSAGTEFDLPFFGPWGQRFNFVAGVRGDGYEEAGVQLGTTVTTFTSAGAVVPPGTPIVPGTLVSFQPTASGPLVNGFAGRIFPQIGLEWNYPWILRDTRSSFVIEPRFAVYAAPNGGNPGKIANNDSEALNFNDTDLFTRNRFTGYDLVDSGQRIDYGVQGTWHIDSGQSLSFLTGESYRFETQSPFRGESVRLEPNSPLTTTDAGDGLTQSLSDYVGRVTYTPSQSLDLIYRYRLDQQDLRPETQEIGVLTGTESFRVYTSLIELGNNLADEETHRLQIGGGINVALDPYWTITASATRDLAGDGLLIASGFGLQYSDECMTFITSFTQNGTRFEDIQPSQALVFTLVLKNLGVITVPAVQGGGL
jgi:LPS-assembly protein